MQKILFNSKYGLEQAVLEGRKTMTRRMISNAVWKAFYRCAPEWILNDTEKCCKYIIRLATIKVGEVVAIAQAYKEMNCADYPYTVGIMKSSNGWNNKMFVRADIMPHHIKITDIKAEPLQDISDEDCLKEGIKPCNFGKKFTAGDKCAYNTPREAFAALIDKVGRKGTWASNPYCFCYTFELVD